MFGLFKNKKTKDIVLYGAGAFAREIACMIEGINKKAKYRKYRLLGFVVDEEYYREGDNDSGISLLGTSEWLIEHKEEVVCTCAIGENCKRRQEIQEQLEARGVKFETIISADVYVPESVKTGDGSVICTEVLLGDNTTIGKGTVINCRTIVGHDVTVGDYTCIMCMCGIMGNVTIGTGAYIGGASYIIPHRKIGSNSLIAAGSVVFTNVKPDTKVLGNPAKKVEL